MTTGSTSDCNDCFIIVPDTTVSYNIKFSLVSEGEDIGFFDAYEIEGNFNELEFDNGEPIIITGESKSRLSELKKYVITNEFNMQYITNGSPNNDGVDMFNTIPDSKIIYYIGGIKYIDTITSGITKTTFSYYGQGYTNLNFINLPYYKNNNKENIISNPKISDDVFIIRQELSAFDNNYRLEYIKNLNDLNTYAGGNFFNIVKNN